jgi:two-component system nitrate/nitrite response regulator NarL
MVGVPRTVLVADDDLLTYQLLLHELRLAGFDVLDHADSAIQAIALAALHQPTIVVLDQMMPGLIGTDAIGAILGASPASKVVLYSVITTSGLADEAVERGAAAVVSKADSAGGLLEALHVLAPPDLGND